MTTRKRWSMLLALALVANTVLAGGPWAGEARACSCISAPLKDEIKRSDAVFSGEVRGIVEGTIPGSGDGVTAVDEIGTATGRVSFAVRDSWKGVTAETVEIFGQGDGANCYNVFEEGESYVVYASRGEGGTAPLRNNECGATKPLAYAEADLRLLGPPTDRLPQTGGVSPDPARAVDPIYVGGIFLAAASLALLAVVVRCRTGRGGGAP